MKKISAFLAVASGAMPLLAQGAQAGSMLGGAGIEIYGYAGYNSYNQDDFVQYASPSLNTWSPPPGLTLPKLGPAVATFSPGLDVPGFSAASGSVSLQNTGESFTSSASLPSGSLHVLAVSTNSGFAASATAQLVDYVTFHVTGASPAVVDVRVTLDGTVTGVSPSAGGYSSDLSFSFGGAFDYHASLNGGGDGYGFQGWSGYQPIYGWGPSGTSQQDQWKYYKASGSTTGFVWDGQLYVTNGENLLLDMILNTTTGGGATADFLNTAKLSLGLPGGVTFTSASGVLLTASAPEPSTWALMLLGFASLSYAGYRRTRKEAQTFDAA
ncbi:PEP-CTERM sorting domain-containing protein [uncultured Rhodoblastus sp.]|uniref:PEP-CTERM sorting domain-containing protein n=1 Tax=uncultured Rhodoblastus sp. TaxID=543037 RepID=UPI0025D8437C|nr:PEP-CTERM sorting domain-containing protein [uncultured Rhodoblastus sp.]